MRRLRATASGLRGRLLISLLTAITVVLTGLILGFNLILSARLDSEANGVLRATASAEVSSLRVSHGRIVLGEAPDDRNPDAQVWVFQGRHALEQPRSPANDAAAAALAVRAPGATDHAATATRLYALPVTQGGRRLGAVVAGVLLAPYRQTRRTALIASAVLAAAVLLAVALAARWLIDRALRPVSTMTRQAADWSEHDLNRRFALGPVRDEITQLASTLDGLLERLAAGLRHEQRVSAEISHELRTPLSSIIAEAQYALRHGRQDDASRATLEHILQSSKQLGRTLDTLMAAARAQHDPRRATSDAVVCAEAALAAGLAGRGSREVRATVNAQGETRVAVERDLVERILAPLVENAARHAHRRVEITVTPAGDEVQFVVDDDGPGVPEQEQDVIFEPGHRGASNSKSAVASAGGGLGLALCRRLARTAGGEVYAQANNAGGRFVVRLPAA